jgi:hypothetical protein
MNAAAILLAVVLMSPSPQAKPKETFWQAMLRVTGITVLPSTSKGQGSGLPAQPAGGDLWTAILDGRNRLRLTRDGGYQSPVFSPDGKTVLALREGKLMRVSTAGVLDPEPLFDLPGVIRLVACDRESPSKVVVLTRAAAGTLDLGLVDLEDRQVHPLRPEIPEAEYREALALVTRSDRAWQLAEPAGVITLEVRPAGQGSDVFCLRKALAPLDVSRCGGDRCDQPSLSADGHNVVFVRTTSRSSGT